MPTQRVTDIAGQDFNDEPVVAPVDDSQLGPPTMGDDEDEARREAAYATPQEAAAAASDAEAGFSAEQTAALERLRRLGSRRVKLRAQLEAVDRELLGEAIIEAFKLGVPKRLIAKESRVVRQTVYNVIERADA